MRNRKSIFSMLGVGIVFVCLQIAGWGTEEGPAVVVNENPKIPSLNNGLLKLDYDTDSGRVSVTGVREGQAFKASGDLGKKAGTVKVEKIVYPGFEDGQALVVDQGGGGRCRVSLFRACRSLSFNRLSGM
jgi:hypothetical protein